MTTALEAVEVLRERRADRARRSSGLRQGWNEQFLSPAEEAAARLAQREEDERLVAEELAREQAESQRDAQAAVGAGDRLVAAADAYIAARRYVEIALDGGVLNVTWPESVLDALSSEDEGERQAAIAAVREPMPVSTVGLYAAISNLVPLRVAYDAAFANAIKYDVVGEHVLIPRLAIAQDLESCITEAVSA